MHIAQLKGEKTVKALAKRLLAHPTKPTPKNSEAKMEAALLRLNPQLKNISRLQTGTTVLVPEDFSLARDESIAPARSLGEAAIQRMEKALSDARAFLEQQHSQLTTQTAEMERWLKSGHAKKPGKKTPELKKVFAAAASVAKANPKEQAEFFTSQNKALDAIEKKLAAFHARHLGA